MLGMMWDVPDVSVWAVECSGCGMFRMWNDGHVECSGCGM